MSWKEAMSKAVRAASAAKGRAGGSDATFAITVTGAGGKANVLRRLFRSSDDVASLRKAICDELTATDKITIYASGVVLVDGKTLGSYGIRGVMAVSIARKLAGGSAMPSEPTYKYPHVFDPKRYPSLRTTRAADSILCIDDADNPRVLAPCGRHGYIGETYYLLQDDVLKKDAISYRVYCPAPGCSVEIPFSFLAEASCMTDSERIYFSTHIGLRSMKSATQTCPTCSSACERPAGLNYLRVRCSCSGPDFCYQCGQLWKGGGFQICGNTLCPSFSLQKAIDTCPEIDLMAGSGKSHKCFKLRACPKCLSIIEWKSACKHFTCTSCKFKFCFLCLKSQDECKKPSYTLYCEIAPRQKLK